MAPTPSPNFKFLSKVDPVIVELAGLAERYVFTDPNSALVKTRQMGELLVKQIFAKRGRTIDATDKQVDLVNDLLRANALTPKIAEMLHEVRKKGNLAVHELHGERGELVPQDPSDEPASELLKRIRQKREAEEAENKAAKAASKKKSKRSKKTRSK